MSSIETRPPRRVIGPVACGHAVVLRYGRKFQETARRPSLRVSQLYPALVLDPRQPERAEIARKLESKFIGESLKFSEKKPFRLTLEVAVQRS
jgi:hypothetical protein